MIGERPPLCKNCVFYSKGLGSRFDRCLALESYSEERDCVRGDSVQHFDGLCIQMRSAENLCGKAGHWYMEHKP